MKAQTYAHDVERECRQVVSAICAGIRRLARQVTDAGGVAGRDEDTASQSASPLVDTILHTQVTVSLLLLQLAVTATRHAT